MKAALKGLGFGLVFIAVWLTFTPTRVDPAAWTPPTAITVPPDMRLSQLQRLAMGVGVNGPEGIAIAPNGEIHAGLLDGRIVALSPDGAQLRELGRSPGRPLGLGFTADGGVLIADAEHGLMLLGAAAEANPLVGEAGGVPLRCTDDVVAATSDKAIYFSDASSKFPLAQYTLDILEHRGNGRLLKLDLASGETHVLLDGLYFANGVTLGPDEAYVLVNETGAYRITRYWLKGERAGTHDVFADHLPGFPDNISFNGRDRFWVAIASPRDPAVDGLAAHPALRKLVGKLPLSLLPKAKAQGFVLAYDLDGKLITSLQDSRRGAYGPITSVRESGPWLWFGSLSAEGIARLPLNAVFPDAPRPPAGWEQAPAQPRVLPAAFGGAGG